MPHFCFMIEEYLHYIWKFQHFAQGDLLTTKGQKLEILYRGDYNHHAGPDFLEAKINLDGVNWFGHVEIHLKSSDWYAHRHEVDDKYRSVVLHVVWEHNKEVEVEKGVFLPVLELKSRCDEAHWKQFQGQLPHTEIIPCAKQVGALDAIVIHQTVTRHFVQRLEDRAASILKLLEASQGDWNRVAWITLSAAFGFKLNKEAFIHFAERVPWKIIERYRNDEMKLLALFFGQAGWLEKRKEHDALERMYTMLKSAYGLVPMQKTHWNFGQVHPANFPTQRLYELAKAVHGSGFKMASLINDLDMEAALEQLRGSKSWNLEKSEVLKNIKGLKPKTAMGEGSAQAVLINAHLPLLFAYGHHHQIDELKALVVDRFQSVPPEQNKTIRMWKACGLKVGNMLESQGLLELFKTKCNHKKCLSCSIGNQILKTARNDKSHH